MKELFSDVSEVKNMLSIMESNAGYPNENFGQGK